VADDEQTQDDNLHKHLRKLGTAEKSNDSKTSRFESYLDIMVNNIRVRDKELDEGQSKQTKMFVPRVASGLVDPWEDNSYEQINANQVAMGGKKQPAFSFSRSDLDRYVAHRKTGLAKKSIDWINREAKALWECTHGDVSEKTMTALKEFTLEKYSSKWAHQKVLGFATAYLAFLAKTRTDPRYRSFDVYLELPKAVKVRKMMTGRIVRREDIFEVLSRIDAAKSEEKLEPAKARNYRAFSLLASYTGLRPSTIQRLTVGQIRTAVKETKPALHVLAEQEKNRVEHWVPLHKIVVDAVKDVLTNDFGDKDDAKPFFMYNSFDNWLRRHRIPLPHVLDPSKAHLWLSDFRKFAEQFGDIISWDTTNRKYVLAHGMTGLEWEHYKAPQREDVYDKYIEAWKNIDLSVSQQTKPKN
jgi:integrase